jgi:hypothetical protein
VNIFDKASGSTAIGGPTDIVAPLLSELSQDSAKPLFPQLSQAFGSLFDAIQPGQQSPAQTTSPPFSPAAADIPSGLLNDPSQLLELLGNASQKLSNGLAATLAEEVNQTSEKAAASGPAQDQQAAQQALLKMQVAVAQASMLMNTPGQK